LDLRLLKDLLLDWQHGQILIDALDAIAVGALKQLRLVRLLKTALAEVFFEGESFVISSRVIGAFSR
jgi:hypothetical protein